MTVTEAALTAGRLNGPGGLFYKEGEGPLIRHLLPLFIFCSSCFAAAPSTTIAGCPSFPPNNIWNVPVDFLPLHPNSAAIVNSIGAASKLRLDDVMPINIVPGDTPLQAIPPGSSDDDPGLYAI